MRIQGPENRRGFTLLEVLLASAIGLLILYGLYLAIDVNLRFADSGRNAVEHATLARSLTARINADLAPCVGLPDPTRYKKKPNSNTSQGGGQQGGGQQGGGQQGGGQQGGGQQGGGQQGGGQQQSGNMTGSGSSDDATAATPMTTADPVRTVQGDETTLSVFVNRLPKVKLINQDMSSATSSDEDNGLDSDQRVIMYKFEEGKGLWRYESNLTNLNMDGSPVTKGELIAPEVKVMTISYYDGTKWETSWDGTQPSPDNPTSASDSLTPIGPPLAIAIYMELHNKNNPDKPHKIRHVIAIPTAPGKAQMSTDDSLSSEGTPSSP